LFVLTLASAQETPKSEPPPEKEKAELPLQPVVPPHWKPTRRRSVQQVVEPTARIGSAPPPSYAPAPAAAARVPVAPPPDPATVRNCDAGGCYDAGGQRYNGGVGTTLLGPQGQLCTKGVVGAQCF
jgi:hypothetical protein